MLFITLFLGIYNCYQESYVVDEGSVNVPVKSQEPQEVNAYEESLNKVIRNIEAFATKISALEFLLNMTEAKLRENGYGPYSGCECPEPGKCKCYHYTYGNINPKTANYTIRRLYWERELIQRAQNNLLHHYSNILFNQINK